MEGEYERVSEMGAFLGRFCVRFFVSEVRTCLDGYLSTELA